MPLLDLPPAEQFDIATKLAENVGYALSPDAYAAPPKPAPDAMRAQFVRQELGGALVFTVLENENSIVEVADCLNGTYALTVHSRNEDRDHWDDITATLRPEHFVKLGSVAATIRNAHYNLDKAPPQVEVPPAPQIRGDGAPDLNDIPCSGFGISPGLDYCLEKQLFRQPLDILKMLDWDKVQKHYAPAIRDQIGSVKLKPKHKR